MEQNPHRRAFPIRALLLALFIILGTTVSYIGANHWKAQQKRFTASAQAELTAFCNAQLNRSADHCHNWVASVFAHHPNATIDVRDCFSLYQTAALTDEQNAQGFLDCLDSRGIDTGG